MSRDRVELIRWRCIQEAIRAVRLQRSAHGWAQTSHTKKPRGFRGSAGFRGEPVTLNWSG